MTSSEKESPHSKYYNMLKSESKKLKNKNKHLEDHFSAHKQRLSNISNYSNINYEDYRKWDDDENVFYSPKPDP